MEHCKEWIEKHIGHIQFIVPITKGFSSEKKYKILIKGNEYLLRLSPSKSFISKKQEFEVMEELYKSGVKCNKPIIIFKNDEQETVCSIYSYLSGIDAEENITKIPEEVQYKIGLEAGSDLHRINRLSRDTNNWKERKWKKHEHYVDRYFKQGYRFRNDERILRFIEMQYDRSEADKDHLQHDDFHLGNIIIHNMGYAGVLDFNRYDWGDPLHEFVKLEWFTWPVSKAFAHGQVEGYFGKRRIDEDKCIQISVYIAMSIFSTIVWTLEFHPDTWSGIKDRIGSILDHFKCFECVRPYWAA